MATVTQLCPYRCGDMLSECIRDDQGRLVCRATGAPPPHVKSVLYLAPGVEHLDDLMRAIAQSSDCSTIKTQAGPAACVDGVVLQFVLEQTAGGAFDRLHHGYFNLVMVDLRALAGCDEIAVAQLGQALNLVDMMDREPENETRYGFHRVVALMSACDDDRADRMIADLARRGVGTVLRDRSDRRHGPPDGQDGFGAFGRLVVTEAVGLMTRRKPGRRALCASGGGITGIYFEMGVLKCLDDCLDVGVGGLFDMYFGISAGAVVTSLLSNGYTVDEAMAAMVGYPGGRIAPMSLSLVRMSHVNFKDMGERISGAVRYMIHQLFTKRRRLGALNPTTLVLQVGDLLGPPLRGDEFERVLRDLFSKNAATNDFRALPKPLYIGATDQDARKHVLFGDGDYADIPISLAVQASFSINPAFASTLVRGRYYEDGAVTQTSNFEAAIARGADLIFIVDPFVPYVSKAPGFARRRGMLYNADQDLRTLSYTRFEKHRNLILRQHSEVSSYTFLPANRLRRLMSINPMDHRPYLEIWRGAYLSTLQRVQALRHRMCGDLAVHGVALDTSKAEEVAARLRSVDQPVLADFFPDRRIALRTLPPLARARSPEPPTQSSAQEGFVPKPKPTAA